MHYLSERVARILALSLFSLLLASCGGGGSAESPVVEDAFYPEPEDEWELVWQDEFDGDGLLGIYVDTARCRQNPLAMWVSPTLAAAEQLHAGIVCRRMLRRRRTLSRGHRSRRWWRTRRKGI